MLKNTQCQKKKSLKTQYFERKEGEGKKENRKIKKCEGDREKAATLSETKIISSK